MDFEKILAKKGEMCKKQTTCVWTQANIDLICAKFPDIAARPEIRAMLDQGPCGMPLPKYELECKILLHRSYCYGGPTKDKQVRIILEKCSQRDINSMLIRKKNGKDPSDPEAWESRDILPSEVADVFDNLSPYTIRAMGFAEGGTTPRHLVTSVMIIPSPLIRPSINSASGSRSEDDLTFFYKEVLRAKVAFVRKKDELAALRNVLEKEANLGDKQDRLVSLCQQMDDAEAAGRPCPSYIEEHV